MDFYLTTSASTFPRIKITWSIVNLKYAISINYNFRTNCS
jgi:hypothetical protein